MNTIPNPFQFVDPARDPSGRGFVTSVESWQARRAEIRELLQKSWYGYRWPTAAEDVSADIIVRMEPNAASFGGFRGRGATSVNFYDSFAELTGKLKTAAVTVGTQSFGPAADEEEAAALAAEAWNAGYSIHWKAEGFFGFGAAEGDAVGRDYTGAVSAGHTPPERVPVRHTMINVRNPGNGAFESFEITVDVPSEAQKLAAWGNADEVVPFVVGIGGPVGAFDAANLNAQGYGLVTFNTVDIYPDYEGGDGSYSRDGVYTRLYPYDPDVYEYDSGAQMSWGWAASQILTAFGKPVTLRTPESVIPETETRTFGAIVGLDPARTAVTGHSRNGQCTILTAAMDDRFRIAIPSEPATGSFRYKVEGKIFNFNVSYYPKADRVYGRTGPATNAIGGTWVPAHASKYLEGEREAALPFDPGDMIALVAPRPYLNFNGIDQHWQGNEGIVAVVQAAAEVYNYIGRTEREKKNIGVRARQSDHRFYPQDFCFALAVLDREFKQGADDGTLHVQDLFPDGEDYATMSYPAADYDNISDMSSYPFEVSSSFTRWSAPNKYMLWTAQDSFLTAHDVTITAHSDAPQVVLTMPDGTRIPPCSKDGEVFTFALSAERAVYGSYFLSTEGTEKENRRVCFSAVSLADALRHGTTKGDEGEENRVLGFSSRLANTPEDPPAVFIDGKKTDMNYTSARSPKEETTLLGYGIQFHDKLFARLATEGWDRTKTFRVDNLKFVTLPDYTFQFSMADIYASAENSGKEGAAKFTKAISWPVERYNNGPAAVWPPIPDTQAERRILANGGTVTRPAAPAPWKTDFDAELTSAESECTPEGVSIRLRFSEPLDKGEFALGFDALRAWESAWNEAGDELTVKAAKENVKDAAETNLILFRLMDTDGNLIAHPIERKIRLR